VPLYVRGVLIGSSYMYMRDAILMIRVNKYCIIKYHKYFRINANKKNRSVNWKSLFRYTKLCSKMKKECHPRGKWNTRYSYFQTFFTKYSPIQTVHSRVRGSSEAVTEIVGARSYKTKYLTMWFPDSFGAK